MRRHNKFAGILQPRQVGAGSPEVTVIVLYDVEADRIRNKVAELCMDYGLERIQFSAFLGKINRNRRQELSLRIQKLIGSESARVRIVPVTEDALRETWVLDQYRIDADKLKEKAAAPALRVIPIGKDE
jgi:CRISPR-associated protein Cas2